MAHYAFLDEQNVVTEVIVGRDENEGTDWEAYYAAVRNQKCRRTSYHTYAGVHRLGGVPFRKNFAGIGHTFREDLDAFIPPCPGEGYMLDEATGTWREGQ